MLGPSFPQAGHRADEIPFLQMPFQLWALPSSSCEASEVMMQLDQTRGSAAEVQDYLDFYFLGVPHFLYFSLHTRYQICIPMISVRPRAAPGTCSFQPEAAVFKAPLGRQEGEGTQRSQATDIAGLFFNSQTEITQKEQAEEAYGLTGTQTSI